MNLTFAMLFVMLYAYQLILSLGLKSVNPLVECFGAPSVRMIPKDFGSFIKNAFDGAPSLILRIISFEVIFFASAYLGVDKQAAFAIDWQIAHVLMLVTYALSGSI